jgi:hypothetical protein
MLKPVVIDSCFIDSINYGNLPISFDKDEFGRVFVKFAHYDNPFLTPFLNKDHLESFLSSFVVSKNLADFSSKSYGAAWYPDVDLKDELDKKVEKILRREAYDRNSVSKPEFHMLYNGKNSIEFLENTAIITLGISCYETFEINKTEACSTSDSDSYTRTLNRFYKTSFVESKNPVTITFSWSITSKKYLSFEKE